MAFPVCCIRTEHLTVLTWIPSNTFWRTDYKSEVTDVLVAAGSSGPFCISILEKVYIWRKYQDAKTTTEQDCIYADHIYLYIYAQQTKCKQRG